MYLDHELNDSVSFEIPSHAQAKLLVARLRPAWRGEIDDLGVSWAVIVELRPDRGDLAVLLRDVQSWLDVSGLGAIRFRVDGRDYVLAAAEPVRDGAPA